jgi:hypothetical protein
MGERNQEHTSSDTVDDLFEPILGDMMDEDFEEPRPISTEKQRLAAMRRRAEQRLEEKRLRDQLGYYDLELDDF